MSNGRISGIRVSTRWACLAAILMALAIAGAARAQGQVAPVPFGEILPPAKYRNLNPAAGPESFDLGSVLGRKPFVLYYWIPGNPRADEVFQELQSIVQTQGTDKVALIGVVLLRPERGIEYVNMGVEKLGLQVPILEDPDFKIGQQLRVQSVPNISIVDVEGRLRLTNGASLAQDLEYKMTVRTAVERVAQKGSIGTYGYLDRYYPVNELVGKQCPDFKAPLLSNKIEQRWSSMLDDSKLNVLIFWSVDCPHCRESLPEINDWLKKNPDGINVVSAAKVTGDASETRTREFCEVNAFAFPTLMDQDLRIAELYRVTATPTILVIRPDGVIDSVLMAEAGKVAQTLEQKKRELLRRES